jgi:cytochrome c-type biogenesis protein CcmF
MLALLGYLSLILSLACALYACVMAVSTIRRPHPATMISARRAAFLPWPLLTLASICLIVLLVTEHFEVGYVAEVTSRAMPTYLRVTALWGGQAGSLLFWAWLMSTFTGVAMLRKWDEDRVLMPAVIVASMVTLGFFVGLVVFFENPFAFMWQTFNGEIVQAMWQPANALPFTAQDGRGLNPLLRHPGMIIHPPMLYLGFVSFTVPYAFAMAALFARRADDQWIRTTRRWTLVGWLFLSLGLILGGRWAYDVLGWGGYWGWDPVENAAFLPWLTGTAFLHSVMIQEKRGMLKKWNMVLIILTYALVIFGTFLTRSGVLSSVHAFAQSAIGPSFFIFIGFTFVVSLWLLFREWDHLRSETQLDSLLSRESAFLLNNLLFLGIAASVFWGTISPMISELFTGQKITVGPPFYNQVTGPQFAALVLLMGIAPLLAWRKASAKALGRLIWIPGGIAVVVAMGCYFWLEMGQPLVQLNDVALTLPGLGLVKFVLPGLTRASWMMLGVGICVLVMLTTLLEFWRGTQARMRANGENVVVALTTLMARNRRRYGGYIIHLGVVTMAVGVIGSNFYQQETQGRLKPGEQLTLSRYVMVFEGLDEFRLEDNRDVARATVSVYRDGQLLGELYPRRDFYFDSQQPMTIPGVRSAIEDDFYVLLVDWEPIAANGATFKVYLNPLVNWIWAGGLVFILGTLVAAWPIAEERRVAVPRTLATQGATD